MLRSEPMEMFVLVAERAVLARVVHVLHSLGIVHFENRPSEDPDFLKTSGMLSYFPAERHLITVRSLREYLQVKAPAKPTPRSEAEVILTLPERLENLQQTVNKERMYLDQLKTQAQELSKQIRSLRPVLQLDVPLSIFDQYQSVEPILVNCADIPEASVPGCLGRISPPGLGKVATRVYIVDKENVTQARAFLASQQATFLENPAIPGDHSDKTATEVMADLRIQSSHIDAEVFAAVDRMGSLSQANSEFLCSAEEALVALLEKSQGTTKFAQSEYLAVARFWTPIDKSSQVFEALNKEFFRQVALNKLSEKEAEGLGFDPPTRLNNPKWAQPFETLLEMYDVPQAYEIDPTNVIAVAFPLFFGFMIGDLGYGVCIVILAILIKRFTTAVDVEARNAAKCLATSGWASIVFGIFVFADCFGIPFHTEPGHHAIFVWGEWFSWLPHALIHKTSTSGLNEMLLLSVIAGWLLMAIGCIFAVVNNWNHLWRHCIAAVGKFLIITALSIMIIHQDLLANNPIGYWLWEHPLAFIEDFGVTNAVFALFLPGLCLYLIGEGGIAFIETPSLFSNIMSFVRLGIVGFAKGAMAAAANDMLLPAMVSSNRMFFVALTAFIILAISHLGLLLLGILSSAIQAIRLHYVETFPKFFEGNGVKYEPFGIKRIYTKV